MWVSHAIWGSLNNKDVLLLCGVVMLCGVALIMRVWLCYGLIVEAGAYSQLMGKQTVRLLSLLI